jgi:hypothetical protein
MYSPIFVFPVLFKNKMASEHAIILTCPNLINLQPDKPSKVSRWRCEKFFVYEIGNINFQWIFIQKHFDKKKSRQIAESPCLCLLLIRLFACNVALLCLDQIPCHVFLCFIYSNQLSCTPIISKLNPSQISIRYPQISSPRIEWVSTRKKIRDALELMREADKRKL